MSAGMTTPASQRTFLGHPMGLYVLFFTEMWERFSYYGMRALLILYMVNYFRWEQKDASSIYKIYTSFVYVTPILGGYLADRYLGNRVAVIIGAVLMAIGHFLMAFETTQIFYAALIFLVMGNGFFKPNMSTQVGRLYPKGDGRVDGAYTIFYMGINLGAFLSPIACGWLMENTVGGYHSGFTLAGIGMVIGLLTYLIGQPWIKEIDPEIIAVNPQADKPTKALTEAQAATTPYSLGIISRTAPMWLSVLAVGTILASLVLFLLGKLVIWDALMVSMGGICLALVAWVSNQVTGGLRDRVLAIMGLGVFVIFFWGAFEQAGNAQNLWADQSTNRFMTRELPAMDVIPEAAEVAVQEGAKAEVVAPPANVGLIERFQTMFTLKPREEVKDETWGQWLGNAFNPVPTAWFQSINALAIFVIAPLFAFLWIRLDRIGKQPSIPMKMTIGLLFMSASMAVMIGAAKQEHVQTIVKLTEPMPSIIPLTPDNQLARNIDGVLHPFHAERLTYDPEGKQLVIYGVLPTPEKDRIVGTSAPVSFQELIAKVIKESVDFETNPSREPIRVKLDPVPPGFAMKYAGIKSSLVSFNAATQELVIKGALADREEVGLMVAAGAPAFRDSVNKLFVESNTFRISPWWLFWSFILATLGELCLSPVGLSMVSKLAPAKFATMLMGCWLLTSAFGNFAAGTLGEIWGTIPPIQFFLFSTVVVAGAAVVLFVVSRWIVRAMHGVE